MAYMRGEYYLWTDESGLHLWNADGYDGWDMTSWLRDENGERHPGMENASGVSIPQEIMDEYVMMRLAQMLHEGLVKDAVERAIKGYGAGNVGSHLLDLNAEAICQALRNVETHEADWQPHT